MTKVIIPASSISRGGGGSFVPPVINRIPVSLQPRPDSPLHYDGGPERVQEEEEEEEEVVLEVDMFAGAHLVLPAGLISSNWANWGPSVSVRQYVRDSREKSSRTVFSNTSVRVIQ